MKVDLVGKIKNTNLSRSKALLPMFEAVVNSFQAIEDASEAVPSPRIEILVERDPVLQGVDIDGDVNGFTIIDNGVGFDEANLDSFFTSDTQYKVSRGGKGIGRFMWLKAFAYAEIESHYYDNGKLVKRVFTFTTNGEQPTEPPTASQETGPKTAVRLVAMRSPYKESCPRDLTVIGHRLVEHYLPFFLDLKCPAVSISDGKDCIDLNNYFQETFAAKASQHTFKVGDTTFTLRGLRLHSPRETQHRLLYAANSRGVLSERLDKYLLNLQKKLADDVGVFVYLGFVEGEYLDQHVNSERTDFFFPADRNEDGLFDELTLDTIRESALPCVSSDLQPFLEEINTEKRTTINTYITQEAPQYRPLVRYMDEIIDAIPPGTTGMALEMALHRHMYEKERELKLESHALIEENNKETLKPTVSLDVISLVAGSCGYYRGHIEQRAAH